MENTIYLVDAYAHIYRCFYGVRELTNSKGQPTNAIFAFGRFLLSLEKEYSAEYGAFVFDCGPPTHRLEIAPDYKAQRPPMPDLMRPQIPIIKDLIRAAGWEIKEKEGYEADDVIATIATRFTDSKVKIISNDKDISQLIDDRVKMLIVSPKVKGRLVEHDRDAVILKLDVAPDQVVDYLSLVGDASDNIPGVRGVGPKTAAKLLNEYGNIDQLISRVDEIKNVKLKEKIETSFELLRKNRSLIELICDIESDDWVDIERMRIFAPDIDKLLSIADEYELKSLSKDIEKVYSQRTNPVLFDF